MNYLIVSKYTQFCPSAFNLKSFFLSSKAEEKRLSSGFVVIQLALAVAGVLNAWVMLAYVRQAKLTKNEEALAEVCFTSSLT